MATKQSTIDYLLDQMQGAGNTRARKMFGEYAIYCNDKVVALVCDDLLYVKPTAAGKSMLKHITEAPPYPGASMYYLLDAEIEDREFLALLIEATEKELPKPKPKKPKAKKAR